MRYFGGMQTFNIPQSVLKRLFSSKDITTVRPEYLSKLQECYRLEEAQQLVIPQFKRALLYGNNIAVKDYAGEYTYFQLYMQSKRLSRQISNICGSCSCSTIGLFYSNDVLSIVCLWACWMAGQVVLPLVICSQQCEYADLPQLLVNTKCKMIINSKSQKLASSSDLANALGISHIEIDHNFMKQQNYTFNLKREVFITDNLVFFEGLLQNNFYTKALALLLYYRNDKNPTKWEIVSVSHKQLAVQMKSFVQTWNITPDDRVLNIFSTQRVNDFAEGILFPLNKGCCLHLLEPYEATNAWSLLMGINMPAKDRVNVVIAEPKVYQNLIVEYDKIFGNNSRMVDYIKEYCLNRIRSMISCFDKLPTETYGRWFEITGHSLFESSSVCGMDLLKKLQTDYCLNENEFDITNMSLSSGAVKFRIIDSSNKVLLESNGKSNKRLLYTTSRTVVGSLWILSPSCKGDDEEEISYFSTGDVVMYQDGIFKFVGRCSKQ